MSVTDITMMDLVSGLQCDLIEAQCRVQSVSQMADSVRGALEQTRCELDLAMFELALTRQQVRSIADALFGTLPDAGIGFGWRRKSGDAAHLAFKVLESYDLAERHPHDHTLVRLIPHADLSGKD